MALGAIDPAVMAAPEAPQLQTYMKNKYTPLALFNELSKPCKAEWQKLLQPELEGEGSASYSNICHAYWSKLVLESPNPSSKIYSDITSIIYGLSKSTNISC